MLPHIWQRVVMCGGQHPAAEAEDIFSTGERQKRRETQRKRQGRRKESKQQAAGREREKGEERREQEKRPPPLQRASCTKGYYTDFGMYAALSASCFCTEHQCTRRSAGFKMCCHTFGRESLCAGGNTRQHAEAEDIISTVFASKLLHKRISPKSNSLRSAQAEYIKTGRTIYLPGLWNKLSCQG